MQLARPQYGFQYHYVLTGLQSSGGHVYAELEAFNGQQIKHVTVDWDE